MVLRSDHYDHPMRFERAMNLMLYRIIEDKRVSGKYSFEVRTNAKLPNPKTGGDNIRINVKNKKDADGIIWLTRDLMRSWRTLRQGFGSYSTPRITLLHTFLRRTDELLKDIKCRYKRKPQYSPTVGMLVCSTN